MCTECTSRPPAVPSINASYRSAAARLEALGLTTRLRLTLERAGDAQIVIVRGKRWGHAGLLFESRRGQGAWAKVGILGGRALRDTRPHAVRGQPEVRENRARLVMGRRRSAAMGRRWRG